MQILISRTGIYKMLFSLTLKALKKNTLTSLTAPYRKYLKSTAISIDTGSMINMLPGNYKSQS